MQFSSTNIIHNAMAFYNVLILPNASIDFTKFFTYAMTVSTYEISCYGITVTAYVNNFVNSILLHWAKLILVL